MNSLCKYKVWRATRDGDVCEFCLDLKSARELASRYVEEGYADVTIEHLFRRDKNGAK